MVLDSIPEWKYVLYVIPICILINLTLPLWLWIAKHCDHSRAREKNLQQLGVADERGKGISELSTKHTPSHDGDVSTIASDSHRSTVSSVVTSLTAVLEARPKRRTARRVDRKRRRRERDIRCAATVSKFVLEEGSTGYETSVPVGDESVWTIMSKLTGDGISTNLSITEKQLQRMQEIDDISCEKKTCWNEFLEIAAWDSSLASLAGFYMIQGVTETIFSILEVAIISYMIGTIEANAYIMVLFLFEWTSVFTVGFQEAIGVLVPQADGADNDLMVGRYLQIGTILGVLSELPGFLVWSLWMYDALIWFSFDEATASIAQSYTYSILFHCITDVINDCLLIVLDVTDHEKYVTIYSVIYAILSAGALFLMAYSGVSNMAVIGLGQTLVGLVMLIINILYIGCKGWFKSYSYGLLSTFGLRDRRAVKTSFVTAIPLAVTWILSIGEWQVMILFAKSIGQDEVVAWNLLGYIWELFETLTTAISEAAEVRVGFRMGAGKPQEAKRMSEKSIFASIAIAIITAVGLVSVARFIPSWITPNPVYQDLIYDLLPLVGLSGILMVPGMVIESVLCAQGRVRLMTTIEIVISWFVAIPFAAILVYWLDTNLEGILIGLILGYSIGVTVLMFFFVRSDWEQLSLMVIKQNAADGAQYIDTDWDDLPQNVRDAACALGYTKIMWETNIEPGTTKKTWNDLTEVEQQAAGVLGYNKIKWDGGNDDEDGNEQHDFEKLPLTIKRAAEVLGFTRSIWERDETLPIESKNWTDLTEEQQSAAAILGYTEQKWEAESLTSFYQRQSNFTSPSPYFTTHKDLDFHELPALAKKVLKVLGYTPSIWNNGGNIQIAGKEWIDLTEMEREALSAVGFTRECWENQSKSLSVQHEDETSTSHFVDCYNLCGSRNTPSPSPTYQAEYVPSQKPTEFDIT